MMPMKLRILPLGEIVTPDFNKSITSFIALFSSNGVDILPQQIGGFLFKNMNKINEFKLGNKTEQEFDQEFIAAIEQEFKVTINENELNEAWKSMAPSYAEYSDLLQQAIAFNCKQNCQVIFYSFTNPKDMCLLKQDLDANKIPYSVDGDGQLNNIAGIPLHLTYTNKQSKAELLKTILGTVLNSDVAIITSNNTIANPVLRADYNRTQESLEQLLREGETPIIVWNKADKQPLSEVLAAEQIQFASIAKL